MTYIGSNASFSSIFRKLEAFSLTVWMLWISFPYRLALSHCHGLFFVIWLGQFPFFFFDCPSEEGAHSCLETSWEKVKLNHRLKKNFLFFVPSQLFILSWDKNLINHDFHWWRLREVNPRGVVFSIGEFSERGSYSGWGVIFKCRFIFDTTEVR